MVSKVITVTITEDLLKEIDEAAKASYESRSDYLRRAALIRLKNQQAIDDAFDSPQAQIG